jgi:hypothetical protein
MITEFWKQGGIWLKSRGRLPWALEVLPPTLEGLFLEIPSGKIAGFGSKSSLLRLLSLSTDSDARVLSENRNS